MSQSRVARFAALVAVGVVVAWSASTRAGGAAIEPQLIGDASLKAITATVGGADVLPTTRTVAHWWGATLDPNNSITYGYNMVGADPSTCSGAQCSVTIEADIVPISRQRRRSHIQRQQRG